MENTLNQRVSDVIRFLIFSKVALDKQDLAQKLGYNVSSFSQIINGRVPLSNKFVEKLIEFAPNLNEHWLKTGEGEMLKVPATLTVFAPTDEERREIGEGVDIKAYPAEVVEEIKAEVAEEIKEEMAIPIISPEIANDPKTNIKKYIDDKADELEHINPSDLTHQADGAERIRKTSMLPTFAPGDIVFVKFIKDKHNIIDGQTYYFDMRTRPTMIRRVKIEGDKLRLIAKNPAFGDILVSFDDILNIADIVGLFRSSFGDQYDEIETVRRKKDEQIDNLLEQNGGLIEQNGEALKIIRDLLKK